MYLDFSEMQPIFETSLKVTIILYDTQIIMDISFMDS